MLNKIILIGRLGKDPETKHLNDNQVANFSVATSERWNDRNGERQERTEWHRIQAWGKLAEICGQYLKKGSLVYIEGKVKTRSWETESGEKRYVTEVIASQMQMLGSKNEEQSQSQQPPQQQQTPTQPPQQRPYNHAPGASNPPEFNYDELIPF